jgi:hypothetical protein
MLSFDWYSEHTPVCRPAYGGLDSLTPYSPNSDARWKT